MNKVLMYGEGKGCWGNKEAWIGARLEALAYRAEAISGACPNQYATSSLILVVY